MTSSNSVEQFFNIIMQLRKLAFQKAAQSAEEKTATMLQFSALNFLKEQQTVTVSDLAQFSHLSKSSATQLSERLVKMGYVKRGNDKQDRRVINLTLTPQGAEGLIVLKKEILNKMTNLFAKLPQNDLAELIRISTNLVKTLEQTEQI